ncbi:MAG: hypothetical protein ACOYA9_07680 [Bilifractor sp.]|jgi:hypothetical protein
MRHDRSRDDVSFATLGYTGSSQPELKLSITHRYAEDKRERVAYENLTRIYFRWEDPVCPRSSL